jgi:Fe-S-cluster containining protein
MQPTDLAAAVEQASHRPDITDAVSSLYSALETRIAIRRPLCVVSGRCCRFDEYGHRLYVTTMELAAFMYDLRLAPVEPIPQEGGCPFQKSKLCSVHTIRPMGCRLFFCDTTATEWQRDQYEKFHAELKRLHETLAVPYSYMEWRTALTQLGLNQPC